MGVTSSYHFSCNLTSLTCDHSRKADEPLLRRTVSTILSDNLFFILHAVRCGKFLKAGGVSLDPFLVVMGCKSRKKNPQKLTQLSSRSHPRHLVGKRTAQKRHHHRHHKRQPGTEPRKGHFLSDIYQKRKLKQGNRTEIKTKISRFIDLLYRLNDIISR